MVLFPADGYGVYGEREEEFVMYFCNALAVLCCPMKLAICKLWRIAL